MIDLLTGDHIQRSHDQVRAAVHEAAHAAMSIRYGVAFRDVMIFDAPEKVDNGLRWGEIHHTVESWPHVDALLHMLAAGACAEMIILGHDKPGISSDWAEIRTIVPTWGNDDTSGRILTETCNIIGEMAVDIFTIALALLREWWLDYDDVIDVLRQNRDIVANLLKAHSLA